VSAKGCITVALLLVRVLGSVGLGWVAWHFATAHPGRGWTVALFAAWAFLGAVGAGMALMDDSRTSTLRWR